MSNISLSQVLDRTYPVRLYGGLQRNPQLLGDLLLSAGKIDRQILRSALQRRQETGARLGTVLREGGVISGDALTEALSVQWGLGRVDLEASPPDPDLLLSVDLAACIRCGCLPWRRLDGRVIIVLEDPFLAEEAQKACGFENETVALALAPEDSIRKVLEAMFRPELEHSARFACPDHLSCRALDAKWLRLLAGLTVFTTLATCILAPIVAFWAIFGWIIVANFVITTMRLGALAARLVPGAAPMTLQKTVPRLSSYRDLPVISLLVPLHREERVLPALMKHLGALNYPREFLDLKLLVEENDSMTLNAIARLDFTDKVDVIRVPENTLKTKPRAMNYGLNFCKGDIVGILDAEDRPEPDQLLLVIEYLHYAPATVACVQGSLDFYNPKKNWLSRCFTLEYAIWFRVLMAGMRRLKLPVPLGGTTVYFRRKHLEQVGGWDAHNVTEDADLGMRLARFGYSCEILPSTTWEEANCRPLAWVRQRSRWLKGFMMTWLTHMRRPRQLAKDLGWSGFMTFQAIFLGGVTAYLSIPILWGLWVSFYFYDIKQILGGSEMMWQMAFWSMISGQIVMLSISLTAALSGGKRHLIPWIITLPFYWPLGALATFKALAELVFAPFYWDKTEHGHLD